MAAARAQPYSPTGAAPDPALDDDLSISPDAQLGENEAEVDHDASSRANPAEPRFDSRPEVRELFLSGGNIRAALCSVGCIGYLIVRDLWDGVDEVVSVSGGSLINGALVADQLREHPDGPDRSGNEATLSTLAAVLTRLTTRKSHPLLGLSGVVLVLPLLLGLGVVVCGVLISLLLNSASRSLVAGLLFVPVTLAVVRGWAARLIRVAVRFVLGPETQQRSITRGRRDHVIVTTSLATRAPRYFIWHRLDRGSKWQAEPAVSAHKAVRASCSVPFTAVERHNSVLHGNEVLADAGWGGKFGEQWRGGTFSPHRFMVKRGFIALDAGTHAGITAEHLRWIGRVSFIWRLRQWLETSNEAVYHNDLWDLSGGLVRVCSPPPDGEDLNMAKLNAIRRRTAALGLLTRRPDDVATAVVAGFLSTAVALESDALTNARSLLISFGEQLDAARETEGSAPFMWSVLLERTWNEA